MRRWRRGILPPPASRRTSVVAGDGDGRLAIGLISGTSADGIDAAMVRIRGAAESAELALLHFISIPYPAEIRRELLALYAADAANAVARLCSLNVILGELFAAAALQVCQGGGVPIETVEVIGSHGQTVWHEPDASSPDPLTVRSTLQIGEAAVIAERTGIQVVANFRVADIAAGGHGAPLVPYFDWVVLRHPQRARAVQNIGGIGNVTALLAGGGLDTVIAFDTGPGNMVIDGLVSLLTGGELELDRDGELAATGVLDHRLLSTLLADDYLDQPPPKTTGRERYGQAFCRQLLQNAELEERTLAAASRASNREQQQARNLIATATAFTAHSIADAYRRWLPPVDEVIVGGGGSRNPTLMRLLAQILAPVAVTVSDAHGVDSRAKEAMAFALMAHDGIRGLPTNVPSATGARRAVILGQLVHL